MSLLIDFCNHAAAKYAVEHWHYSETLPVGKLVKVGVWENEQFIGVVMFARGASNAYGHRFGVRSDEVCELVRVALDTHTAPVTQIVAEAIRQLKASSPGLRVIVSFADQGQGHLGTIYQAGNWSYLGTTDVTWEYFYRGRWVHDRIVNGRTIGGDLPEVKAGMTYVELKHSLRKRPASTKYRYAYPLDKKMRRLIKPMELPYPTADDLAAQVSEAKHRPTRVEGQVQSLGAAPNEQIAVN